MLMPTKWFFIVWPLIKINICLNQNFGIIDDFENPKILSISSLKLAFFNFVAKDYTMLLLLLDLLFDVLSIKNDFLCFHIAF